MRAVMMESVTKGRADVHPTKVLKNIASEYKEAEEAFRGKC